MLLDFSPGMLPHPLAWAGLFGPLCYYLLKVFMVKEGSEWLVCLT